jgi:hypothetical protein
VTAPARVLRLGDVATSLPGWAWARGVVSADTDDYCGLTCTGPRGGVYLHATNNGVLETSLSGGDVPDIDQPATWGHLLHLLGPGLVSVERTRDGWTVAVRVEAEVVMAEDESIGGAAVLVAERIGRWPGGVVDA